MRGILKTASIAILLSILTGCGGAAEEAESLSNPAADNGVEAAKGEAIPPNGINAATEANAAEPSGPPVDLLTYGAGAFPIRLEAGATASAKAALDGIPNHVGIERLDSPINFVVELPAETTFETFVIPLQSVSGCCRGRHVKTVIVEGSNTNPDDGFTQIARFDVDPEIVDPQSFQASARMPVRWVRITFDGRQTPYQSAIEPTGFTELIGYGTQAPIVAGPDDFTGLWLTGGGGGGDNGNRIELIQDGALITGCGTSGGARFTVTGGIENGLAKLRIGRDNLTTVAIINSEDQLSGYLIGRSFPRLLGNAGGNPTQCSPGQEPPPNPVAEALDAGQTAILYGINFDVDSDVLRSDATPALNQILSALEANDQRSVTIEGHTDSDASDEHNLDLSQRRAQAVVNWLVERGIATARLTPVGKGEAEPVADNGTSAGKAANRRVEVEGS